MKLSDFERAQLIIQLKTLKIEMIRTYPQRQISVIDSVIKNDPELSKIIEACGIEAV